MPGPFIPSRADIALGCNQSPTQPNLNNKGNLLVHGTKLSRGGANRRQSLILSFNNVTKGPGFFCLWTLPSVVPTSGWEWFSFMVPRQPPSRLKTEDYLLPLAHPAGGEKEPLPNIPRKSLEIPGALWMLRSHSHTWTNHCSQGAGMWWWLSLGHAFSPGRDSQASPARS